MMHALREVLFPPQCAACEAFGSGFCDACAPAGVPVTVALRSLHVRALGRYEGPLRTALLAVKDGRRDVAAALGARMARMIAPGSLLVPVPTTAARRRVRGFDGGVLLARLAAHASAAQVLEALTHVGNDAQRGRDRRRRMAATGRFRCETDALVGVDVVLLDDVVTTGATLEDCAAALRLAGACVCRAVAAAATSADGQ